MSGMVHHKPAQIYFTFPRHDHHDETFSAGFAPFDSGTWRLQLLRVSDTVRVEWFGASRFVIVESIRLATSLAPNDLVLPWKSIKPYTQFPPQGTGLIEFHVGRAERLSWVRLELLIIKAVEVPKSVPTVPQAGEVERRAVARHNAINFSAHAPNDVVFYFPRCNRELWANSKPLAKSSTYFKDMFGAGFSETTTKSRQAYVATLSDLERSVYDSDDEADKVPAKLSTTRTSLTLPPGVKEVVIKEAAYTTYHAVLSWIHFGVVGFAPLSSTSFTALARLSQPEHKRPKLAAPPPVADAALPAPASPKAVYQLAHFLDLPKLMQLALEDFRTKLTNANVLYQLASSAAIHDDVKKAVFKFAKANWAAVKSGKAMAELSKAEVMEGLGGEFGARLAELVMKC